MPGYRSQVQQSLHYFARPHAEIRRTPLRTAAAWRGGDLGDSEWIETLSRERIEQLDRALDHAPERPTAELRRDEVPLPEWRADFERWRATLADGRGFVVLRGLPVERWSQARAERFFWIFGLHLGIPGAQNPQGDLLGHVRDTGAPTDGSVRQYRTTEYIDYHCDLADVVGLLCLTAAARGGRSRIASSVYLYNELLRRRPELCERLYQPMLLDTKGEGGIPYIPIEPCRYAEGRLRTFWHSGYFRSVARVPGVELSPQTIELLDAHAEIAAEPSCPLTMDLRPGDIQLLSNHTIVHGRSAFVDEGPPRHLLRLWLSLPHRAPPMQWLRRQRSRAVVLGRLARLRLRSG